MAEKILNSYETIFIIDATLAEENATALKDKFISLIILCKVSVCRKEDTEEIMGVIISVPNVIILRMMASSMPISMISRNRSIRKKRSDPCIVLSETATKYLKNIGYHRRWILSGV